MVSAPYSGLALTFGWSSAPWRFADRDVDPALGQGLAQQDLDLGIGAAEIGRRTPLDAGE